MGPKQGSPKEEILRHIGLMGRQRFCFNDGGDDDLNLGGDNGGGGDGDGDKDWHQGLSEDLRGHESLKDYKVIPPGTKDKDGKDIPEVKLIPVPETLVKSYVKQQPLIGSKLVMPKEDAPKEELDKFFTAIGRPEKPEEYELPQEEGWKDLPYSENLETWFRGFAHEIGLNKTQAGKLYQGYQSQIKTMYDEANAEMEKDHIDGQDALKKEWASKAKENIALADRAFHTIFTDEKVSETVRLLMGNNAGFIKAMYEISKIIGEDKLIGAGEEETTTGKKTHEELKQMLADPRYKTDEKYRKEVDEAYKQAFPG